MKRFATLTVIGRDKTGVVARITNFLFMQKANIEALEEQVTRGQFSMTVEAIKSGRLKKAEPALVLSNRRDLESLSREAGLPFEYVGWGERLKAEQLALRILDQHEIDFVVLARFMKILSP